MTRQYDHARFNTLFAELASATRKIHRVDKETANDYASQAFANWHQRVKAGKAKEELPAMKFLLQGVLWIHVARMRRKKTRPMESTDTGLPNQEVEGISIIDRIPSQRAEDLIKTFDDHIDSNMDGYWRSWPVEMDPSTGARLIWAERSKGDDEEEVFSEYIRVEFPMLIPLRSVLQAVAKAWQSFGDFKVTYNHPNKAKVLTAKLREQLSRGADWSSISNSLDALSRIPGKTVNDLRRYHQAKRGPKPKPA